MHRIRTFLKPLPHIENLAYSSRCLQLLTYCTSHPRFNTISIAIGTSPPAAKKKNKELELSLGCRRTGTSAHRSKLPKQREEALPAPLPLD